MIFEKKVVTLCGSSRFKGSFLKIERELTLQGYIVFSLTLFSKADNIELTNEQENALNEIHLRKIELSDEIFVVNVNDYIGKGTQLEINYADSLGKSIRYLEQNDKHKAVLNHRKLWNWIADESEKQQRFVSKAEYFNNFNLPSIINYCYCCEYAQEECNFCPIVWKTWCCGFSEYLDFKAAGRASDLKGYIETARLIANLPERR